MEHDVDDPPHVETATDRYWWYLNRWAEQMMRFARMWGLIALIFLAEGVRDTHAKGWATVVAELCKTGTPICLEEIVADYSWQTVTVLQCKMQGQQGIAQWMSQHPTYHHGWTLEGFKCADGAYVIAHAI